MFERFTDRSRKVMALANQEARRYKHECIGTEHILLGLLKEGSGVGANVLRNLGVDPRKVEAELDKLIKPGSDDFDPPERLAQTARAKKVIEYAIAEARGLNHNYVGTEHLLIGMLREEEGVAGRVLTNFGLTREAAVMGVVAMIGSGAPNDAAVPPPVIIGRLTLPPGWPQFHASIDDVLSNAMIEARALKSSQVRAEHVLLGLLGERTGRGVALLTKLGITPEALRQAAAALPPV